MILECHNCNLQSNFSYPPCPSGDVHRMVYSYRPHDQLIPGDLRTYTITVCSKHRDRLKELGYRELSVEEQEVAEVLEL